MALFIERHGIAQLRFDHELEPEYREYGTTMSRHCFKCQNTPCSFQETVEGDPMAPIKEDVVKVVQIIPQDAMKHRTKEQMDVPVHQSQENSFEVITAVLGERDFEHISDDTLWVKFRKSLCPSESLNKLSMCHFLFASCSVSMNFPDHRNTRFAVTEITEVQRRPSGLGVAADPNPERQHRSKSIFVLVACSRSWGSTSTMWSTKLLLVW